MNNQPLVSIIAGCYNHSRFVIECLESIRNQTYKNIQLIIIDDCSSDNSVEIIENWINDNAIECKFIKHSQNLGVCKTFNEGLSYCDGEYISIVSTDDIYELNKVNFQVNQFEKLSDDYGVLYSDAIVIDENSNKLDYTLLEPNNFKNVPEGNIYTNLLKGDFILPVTTMVKKKCYLVVGNYDEQLAFEDYDMWLRLSRNFKFGYIVNPLCKYRIVKDSLYRRLKSKNYQDYLYSMLRIYEKNFNYLVVSNDERNLAIYQITRISEELYKYDFGKSNTYLFRAFLNDKKIRTLIMLIMCLFKVKYESTIKVINYLHQLKNNYIADRHFPQKN